MIARSRVTHEDVLHALHEVATAAAGGDDSGRIAQLAADHCQNLLDADGIGVRWLEEAEGDLRLLAAAAREPTDHPASMPLHGSLVGRAILEGRSITCDDYQAEAGALTWAKNSGIASIIVVPLLVGRRAVGAISVFSYSVRRFSEEERQLIELLAAAIGPALESARLASVREREATRLAALHALAVATSGELDLVRLVELASLQARTALGCDAASVVLWDEHDQVLRTVTRELRFGLGAVVPKESLAIGPSFESGEPVVINDYRTRVGADASTEVPDLVACVPLSVDGRSIGCLVVADKLGQDFGEDEVRFMTLLAAQLSPALEAARLNSEVGRSESRLREAYEVMSCGVIQGGPGQRVVVNKAAIDILGAEAAGILTGPDPPPLTMWDETGTELTAQELPFYRVLTTSLALRGVTNRIRVGSGSTVWIHGDVVPIIDEAGRVTSVVASFVDVSAMKEAEDARRRSEALFKEAFENSAVGMHITSVATGRIIQANRALHGILGYESGALIGMTISELSAIGNDEAETAERRRLLIEGQVERLLLRRRVKTRDGRKVTVEVNVGLVRDSNRKPLYTVAQIVDVTKQVRVESVLRQEADRMVQIVKAQTEVYDNDLDVHSVLEMLAETARNLTGADGATVTLLESLTVRGRAFSGESGGWPNSGEDLGPSFARHCATTGTTIFTADALSNEFVDQERARATGIHSLAASPLRHDGRTTGVIQVRSRRKGAFGHREANVLEVLAGLAAAAIGRAEMIAAIRESEERLSALVASAPVIVNAVDPRGVITLSVGRGLADLGLDSADVVGTSIHLDHVGRADIVDGVTRALAGETCVRVGRYQPLERDFEARYSPIRDETGAVTGVISVAFDVTDRLASERELAESRASLSAVVANSPVITFAFNNEGEVLLAEGAGLARLDMEPGVSVGMNVFEIFAGMPDAVDHIRRGLGGETFEGIVHMAAFDADFDVRYGPWIDSRGRCIGMSGLATDITDRVRMEHATRENDAKSRLMAMMNHEVRTPLNSVLGFAELLSSGRGGELSEKQARYVSNIEAAGRHLLSLVNDSLDLAKLDAEKMPVVMNDLELGPILDQAIGQVQPLAEARGVTLAAECAVGLYVSADRRRLLQVLWNLLSNAIKHSSGGTTVGLRGRQVGGLVEVAVTDRGTGIPPDQLEKIFEEFHQVGPSQLEGTGLGLTVCRRLVAVMGGSIRVESELGTGSTFTVTLRPETRTGS